MIKVRVTGLEDIVRTLKTDKEKLNKATDLAIKRTAGNVRAEAVRELGETFTAAKKDIRDKIIIKYPAPDKDRVYAEVFSVKKSSNLPAHKFKHRFSKRNGLVLEIKKGDPKKIEKGFKHNSKLYKRTGEDKVEQKRGRYAKRTIKRGKRKGEPILREPIKLIQGIAVADMMNNSGVTERLVKYAQERFVANFKRIAAYIFKIK